MCKSLLPQYLLPRWLSWFERFRPFGLLLVVHLLEQLKGWCPLMLISICPIKALEGDILAQFICTVTLWLSIPTYQSTGKCVTNIYCAPKLVSSFINCISSKLVSMRVKSAQLSEGLCSHARLFQVLVTQISCLMLAGKVPERSLTIYGSRWKPRVCAFIFDITISSLIFLSVW